MAFQHCVMWRWSDAADAEFLAGFAAALDAIPSQVDSVRGFVHGPDAGVNDGNFDYVLIAEFDDVDGYTTYRDHPDHRAVSAMAVGKVAARSAVQIIR